MRMWSELVVVMLMPPKALSPLSAPIVPTVRPRVFRIWMEPMVPMLVTVCTALLALVR